MTDHPTAPVQDDDAELTELLRQIYGLAFKAYPQFVEEAKPKVRALLSRLSPTPETGPATSGNSETKSPARCRAIGGGTVVPHTAAPANIDEENRIMSLTLDQRIALIEADPALNALSQICDLGTCAGPKRGGFQKALDIASDALHSGVERAIVASHPDQNGPTTSADVASIAGELIDIGHAELTGLGVEAAIDLAAQVRTLAGSALAQRA